MTTPQASMLEGHERTILAYLMSPARDACGRFLHRVDERIFANPIHRVILHAARDVFDEGERVNIVTVSERLQEMQRLQECGGRAGISQFATETTGPELAEYALEYVLDDYGEREAITIGKQLQARDIEIEEAQARLASLRSLHGENGAQLIQFKSPLELKNFVPPPGIMLVGDFHIVKGSVFVIGGAPGVGKSRGADALAVAGATESDWFGLTVHRQFKTMIVQNENGEFRLSREFAQWDCEALENYVRISPPPPYGLCFKREDFRKQLADEIGEFKPDILVTDPWNAVAREQDSKEYLDTFDSLKFVLPSGNDAPALGIVAHTRKPKTDERASGRALLNLLAGSYVLGSVPRSVFVMQAASDDVNDSRVVWTCCKNNDGELGARSAWERRNGLFVPVEFFDWDGFDHPPKEKTGGIKPAVLRELLQKGREYDKSQIVKIIMKETGRKRARAYDVVDEAKRKGVLRYHKLTKIYELA